MPIGWIKINFTEDSCNVKGENRIDVSAQTPPTYKICSFKWISTTGTKMIQVCGWDTRPALHVTNLNLSYGKK